MTVVFRTITIDSTQIYAPNDFELERVPIYEGEYTSCTGKTFADLVGWKYGEQKLVWGTLPTDQLRFLIGLTGQHTITFMGMDGQTHTEPFVPTSVVAMRGRETLPDGGELWHDISLSISFIGANA